MKKTITILTAAAYIAGCTAVPQRLDCEQFRDEHKAGCAERNAEIDKRAAEVQQENGNKVVLGIGAALLLGIAAAAAGRSSTPTYRSSTTCSRSLYSSSCTTYSNR